MEDRPDSPVRIARWKGDAAGAVSLYYDDGTDSSFDFVVPLLLRLHLPGTFYLCCGWYKGPDDPKLARWALCRKHPEIVLGNHTWSHCGTTGPEHLAGELRRNAEALRAITGLPPEALVSVGIPGGVPWKVTPEEQAACFAAERLVLRHDFGPENSGGPAGLHPSVRMNTLEDALAILDRAERSRGWEALLFHGVGGDWIAYPAGAHDLLLREAAARQALGRLWIGSAIDVHKYETERNAARLSGVSVSDDGIDFSLDSLPDPAVFDVPLTLVCDAPSGWDSARVTRSADGAETSFRLPAVNGRLVFDAPPASTRFSVRKDA